MARSTDASTYKSAAYLLLAGGCFFVTGLSALVYEVCWIRTASLTFGSATWAVSAVLAVFFAGLALGSLVVGSYSSQVTRPLRLFALLELGVAVWAMASPVTFTLTDQLYSYFYPYVLGSVTGLAATRILLVTIVVLPATTLMGGSLPLFCRQFVRENGRVGRGVGLLYGLNTLGAAAGSAISGFWLIPHLGINLSIYLAGILNLLVSFTAFLLARAIQTPTRLVPSAPTVAVGSPPIPPSKLPKNSRTIVSLLFFGVGFAALGNEVLWTRYLSLWVPNTVHTYTLTLTVVLVGIVLGSLLSALISDRLRWPAGLFGAAQVGSGLAVMAVMQSRPAWWGDWLSPVSVSQQLVVIALVMLPPAILSGLSFPLAIGMVVRDARLTGSVTGRMSAINIVGGIVGSLLVGFVALPGLGLQVTLFLITGLSLLLGIVTWWKLELGVSRLVRSVGTLGGVLAWLAIPWFCQTKLPQDFLATEGTLVDYREGISANVSVIRHAGSLQLEINRMWQGQDQKNHQVMAAHVPSMLHGDPHSVLVIGLGTGQTARSFLLHDIERLDCLEIEDGLVELVAEYFDGEWLEDPRVRVIVEDGRNYVMHTSRRYDLIAIEVGQVYRPGVATFYSLDFYQRLRRRLEPNGLVCQFLPIEFFQVDEFRTLLATFLEAFPQGVLWFNTSELLLIGTNGDRIVIRPQVWEEKLAKSSALKRDLDYAYWGGDSFFLSQPEVFLAGCLCGTDRLREMSEGGEIYGDDRPYLEYISLMRGGDPEGIVALIRNHLSPLSRIVEPSELDLTRTRKIRHQNLKSIVARVSVLLAREMRASGLQREAAQEYERALAAMPEYPDANWELGSMLQQAGQVQEAISRYRRALETRPKDVRILSDLAMALGIVGQVEEAQQLFQQVLAQQPDDVEANYRLGMLLHARNELDEAAACYEHALDNDPQHAGAHANLAGTLVAQGKLQAGIRHYRKALEVNPRVPEVCARLGWALAKNGQLEEAMTQFRTASRQKDDDPLAISGEAWILATHPDAGQRNSKMAVTLAEKAWRLTGRQNAQVADVLAAAYAADGRFEEAVGMAEQALQFAESQQFTALVPEIREHLDCYRQGSPFMLPATQGSVPRAE
jgi:spermidine synthase